MPRAFKKKKPKTKCKSGVGPFIEIYWKRDLGFLKLEEKEQEEILQALIEETWKVLFRTVQSGTLTASNAKAKERAVYKGSRSRKGIKRGQGRP